MPTLKDLHRGERAVITGIVGEDAISLRLMEMGLLEGEEIELIAFAPMGDPIEFAIRGYRLSLRTSEAERVVIDLPAAAST